MKSLKRVTTKTPQYKRRQVRVLSEPKWTRDKFEEIPYFVYKNGTDGPPKNNK